MFDNVIRFNCNHPEILKSLSNRTLPLYLHNVLGESVDVISKLPIDGEVTFTVESPGLKGEINLFPNNHVTIRDLLDNGFFLCGNGADLTYVSYSLATGLVDLVQLEEVTVYQEIRSFFPIHTAIKVAQNNPGIPVLLKPLSGDVVDISEQMVVGKALLVIQDRTLKANISYKSEFAYLVGKPVVINGTGHDEVGKSSTVHIWDNILYLTHEEATAIPKTL